MLGWIRLDRQITEHWLWKGERFSKGQAWVDLLLLANHENKKIIISGKVVEIKKGQHFTSIRKLATRWGWCEETVLSFLKVLESEGMVLRDSRTLNGTLLTLVNWDKFQVLPNTYPHTFPNTEPNTEPAQTTNINKYKQINKRNAQPKPDAGCYTDEEWEAMTKEWKAGKANGSL